MSCRALDTLRRNPFIFSRSSQLLRRCPCKQEVRGHSLGLPWPPVLPHVEPSATGPGQCSACRSVGCRLRLGYWGTSQSENTAVAFTRSLFILAFTPQKNKVRSLAQHLMEGGREGSPSSAGSITHCQFNLEQCLELESTITMPGEDRSSQ